VAVMNVQQDKKGTGINSQNNGKGDPANVKGKGLNAFQLALQRSVERYGPGLGKSPLVSGWRADAASRQGKGNESEPEKVSPGVPTARDFTTEYGNKNGWFSNGEKSLTEGPMTAVLEWADMKVAEAKEKLAEAKGSGKPVTINAIKYWNRVINVVEVAAEKETMLTDGQIDQAASTGEWPWAKPKQYNRLPVTDTPHAVALEEFKKAYIAEAGVPPSDNKMFQISTALAAGNLAPEKMSAVGKAAGEMSASFNLSLKKPSPEGAMV